jgi:hypothetical protein
MGLNFSLFFAELLQMEENIAERSPYHRDGHRNIHKQKSPHVRTIPH